MERGEAEQDDAISGEGIVAEDDADAAHPQPSTASAGQHTSDHEDDDSIDDDAPTLSVLVAEVDWVVLRHLRSTVAAIVAERLADIASARDAASSPAIAAPFQDKDISLISKAGRISFVYWNYADVKLGRVISYSVPQLKVIAIVNARVQQESFEGCTILISKCPFVMLMRKHRAGDTDEVPEWCVLLQRLAEVGGFSGPHEDTPGPVVLPGFSRCLLCQTLEKAGLVPPTMTTEDQTGLWICCQCLCSWHMGCGAAAAKCWAADLHWEPIGFRCPICVAR